MFWLACACGWNFDRGQDSPTHVAFPSCKTLFPSLLCSLHTPLNGLPMVIWRPSLTDVAAFMCLCKANSITMQRASYTYAKTIIFLCKRHHVGMQGHPVPYANAVISLYNAFLFPIQRSSLPYARPISSLCKRLLFPIQRHLHREINALAWGREDACLGNLSLLYRVRTIFAILYKAICMVVTL